MRGELLLMEKEKLIRIVAHILIMGTLILGIGLYIFYLGF